MNERGREALVQAALSGRRQIFGEFHEYQPDGDCAVGVLHRALGRWHWWHPIHWFQPVPFLACLKKIDRVFGLAQTGAVCERCQSPGKSWWSEMNLLLHLNDGHRADFLEIARKAPEAQPGVGD